MTTNHCLLFSKRFDIYMKPLLPLNKTRETDHGTELLCLNFMGEPREVWITINDIQR